MLIPLPTGESAIIDDEDYALVSAYRWHRLKRPHTIYAIAGLWNPAKKSCDTIFMHRIILGATKSEMCDHIDGDGLNNRRSNLRIATGSQNQWNRKTKKKWKGVHFIGPHNPKKPWQALIKVSGHVRSCGCYPTPEQAAAAYNLAALRHFGAFAKLNDLAQKPDEHQLRPMARS